MSQPRKEDIFIKPAHGSEMSFDLTAPTVQRLSTFALRDHPLMTQANLEIIRPPLPVCHTKLPILLGPSYIVSQKGEPPTCVTSFMDSPSCQATTVLFYSG